MKHSWHPAWDREIRIRTRWSRWSRALGLSLLAAMPVALGAVVAWRRGVIDVLWTPAYIFPVLFLQALVWGALWIRSRSGAGELRASAEELELVRRGLSSGLIHGVGSRVVLSEVSSVALMDRPEGKAIVFSRKDREPWVVCLGLDRSGGILAFLHRLPQDVVGLTAAADCLAGILPAGEYERLSRSDHTPGTANFDRLLACHEALGCWQSASDQILALAEVSPTKDDLERLWQVDRMRLSFAGLYAFLTRAAKVIPEVVAADRLRLAMALGFRREVEELLADARRVERLPASLEALPLDVWERASRSGAPFRSGLLHSFVPQGHVSLSTNSVDLGGGRVLPLEFVVAVMARPGFIGLRTVVLFDLWGQRHEVPTRVLDRDADQWIGALRLLAPHIMELREGPWASSSRSLALVSRLESS